MFRRTADPATVGPERAAQLAGLERIDMGSFEQQALSEYTASGFMHMNMTARGRHGVADEVASRRKLAAIEDVIRRAPPLRRPLITYRAFDDVAREWTGGYRQLLTGLTSTSLSRDYAESRLGGSLDTLLVMRLPRGRRCIYIPQQRWDDGSAITAYPQEYELLVGSGGLITVTGDRLAPQRNVTTRVTKERSPATRTAR